MQVAHGDRLNLLTFQYRDRRVERDLVKRDFDPAVSAHSFAHAEPQFARHQLLGRRHPQIVAVVFEALAHLDDIAVALGGQQADLSALAFQQRVGRNRRAVDDALGCGQQLGRVEPKAPRQQYQPIEHPNRRVIRRCRSFLQHSHARIVDRDQIGKRAADIDPNAVHPLLPRRAII